MVTTALLLSCSLLYKITIIQHNYRLLQNDPFCSRPQFWTVNKKGLLASFWYSHDIHRHTTYFPRTRSQEYGIQAYSGFRILFCSVYDVADFMGKSLTAIYVMQSIKKALQSCISRLLFHPVFTACLHGPEWLEDEVLVVIARFMLGLTKGYLTSVLMILGPKSLPVSEAELSAIVLVVFLGIGLVSGSVLGWFWII
ncbi:hypothetical protein Goari_004087 [Gossypium aridum]|uniref:Uncharacterized protein n=1 Tax=Gossypium aridum TaxID=34290 RepID=A0A7J8Y2E2_GOSAI|nr:hypothetical protein [Gossypium aridum]